MNTAVSPRVRTITYVTTLVWGALATGAAGVVAVLLTNGYISDALAAVIVGILGAVSGVVATICGGLGTAYRPTSGNQPVDFTLTAGENATATLAAVRAAAASVGARRAPAPVPPAVSPDVAAAATPVTAPAVVPPADPTPPPAA